MNKRFIATALTGLLAVGLAACSPANEQPSSEKVDTAAEQSVDSVTEGSSWTTEEASASSSAATTTLAAGAQEIAFVDCVAEPAEEPEQVTLDCANPADAVVNIQWATWGEAEAEGTGTSQSTGMPAEVTLSGLSETVDGSVYTAIEVDGVAITQ